MIASYSTGVNRTNRTCRCHKRRSAALQSRRLSAPVNRRSAVRDAHRRGPNSSLVWLNDTLLTQSRWRSKSKSCLRTIAIVRIHKCPRTRAYTVRRKSEGKSPQGHLTVFEAGNDSRDIPPIDHSSCVCRTWLIAPIASRVELHTGRDRGQHGIQYREALLRRARCTQ